MSPEEAAQEIIEEAVAEMARIPSIYLSGPMPKRDEHWCATCVMLFMGDISSQPEFQDYARQMHSDAMAAGAHLVSIKLEQQDHHQLQPAITIGPSWLYREPDYSGPFDSQGNPVMYKHPHLPVCWTHIMGIPPAKKGETKPQQPQSPIIPGKAYGVDQYRG